MRIMDNRQKSNKISRKPGGSKRHARRIVQLSASESEETVLKESQRKVERFKYYGNKPLHHNLDNTNFHTTVSSNSRPQSSISNFSNFSMDGDVKEKDLQSLVQKLSMLEHPMCRVNALSLLINMPVTSFVNCSIWSNLSEQIKQCIADEDLLIYRTGFKLISNIVSNSETVREGFLILLEGSLQISHKKTSNYDFEQGYSECAVPYYRTTDKIQSPFAFIAKGLDLKNPHHKRILQMCKLLLRAQKQIGKHWLRWKESDVQDILDNYIDFLSIQVEYTKSQSDMINLHHVISILDPNAKWLEHWLLNLHIAKKMTKNIKDNYIYFSFIVHIVTEFIQNSSKLALYEVFNENIINENQIRLCLFLHSLSALGHLLKFQKMHSLFPISTKISKNLTIIELIVLLINYLNDNIRIKTSCKSWYSLVEAAMREVISKVLCHNSSIMLEVLQILVKPIQNFVLSFSEVNLACLKILKDIIATTDYQDMVLESNTDKREEQDIEIDCDNEDSFSSTPRIHSPNFIDKINYFKNEIPLMLLNFLNKVLQQCNLDQRLHNAENFADLLSAWLILMEMPEHAILLTNSFTLQSLINCYSHMHKQSSLTNDVKLSNVLHITDKILTKLSCHALGQAMLENHVESDIINVLIKRLINKPKFSCLETNFMILNSHLGSCEDMYHIFENHNLLEDNLLDLWSGVKEVGSYQFGSCLINNENKLRGIINFIYSMSCNLTVIQSSTNGLYSGTCKSDMSLCSTQEDQYPTSLKDLISHICQRVSDSSDVDPESIIDLTNCVKSTPSSESCDQNICDCLICPYEFSVCFVALSVLKVLINNLDVMLFLNNKFKFQDSLLQAQFFNVKWPLNEDQVSLGNSTDSQTKSVIVDELSLIRHQILLSSGYLGGPKESAPKNFTLEMYLKDMTIPRVFAEWPIENSYKAPPSSSYFGRRNFLEEYLWKTRSNINDSFWIKNAREKLKISEDIKNIVLVELLSAIPKDHHQLPIHLLELSMKNEFKTARMFEEDLAAIDLIIGYGLDLNILQEKPYHKKNLTYMMQLCYKSFIPEERIKFAGFDWFVGVVFLICKGNVIRCRKFLQMFTCLPSAPFLWPKLGEAIAKKNLKFGSEMLSPKFAFMHAIEIVMEDFAIERNILQYNGVSWTAITQTWLQQCFLNIINWKQLIRLFACCILYPADFLAYYCMIIFKQMSDSIKKHAARKDLWHMIKTYDISSFSIDNHYIEIEEMRQKFQHILLPVLQIT